MNQNTCNTYKLSNMAQNFGYILAIVFVIGCINFDGVVAPAPIIRTNWAESSRNNPGRTQSGREITGFMGSGDLSKLTEILRQSSFQGSPPNLSRQSSFKKGSSPPRVPSRQPVPPPSSNSIPTDVVSSPTRPRLPSLPKVDSLGSSKMITQAKKPFSGQLERSDSGRYYDGAKQTTDADGNTIITKPMSEDMIRNMLIRNKFDPSLSPTAVVEVRGLNGKSTLARIMIDTGASDCLISERVASNLGLKREHLEDSDSVHFGVGGAKRAIAAANLKLCSRHSNYCLEVHGDIVKTITVDGTTIFDPRTIPDTNLKLAEDDTFDPKDAHLDMLLGAQYFSDIFLHQPKKFPGFPTLYNTKFGYVAIGKGDLGTRYMILKQDPVVRTKIVKVPAPGYF